MDVGKKVDIKEAEVSARIREIQVEGIVSLQLLFTFNIKLNSKSLSFYCSLLQADKDLLLVMFTFRFTQNKKSRDVLSETIKEFNKAFEYLVDFACVEYHARK